MNTPSTRHLLQALLLLSLVVGINLSVCPEAFSLPKSLAIFPGAQGYGSKTVAGSGRHLSRPRTSIIKVSTLAANGPGSLRNCVTAKVPRVCVFEVSGEIKLTKELGIRAPYLTIAGQTAPEPGIFITGAGLRVRTHDVLIQHLSVLVGDDPAGPDPKSRDGISIGADTGAAYNIVVDHCTVRWSVDENISTWYDDTRDVTFSYNLIAEGLEDSIHPKGPHSKGVLIGDGSSRITLHRNLLAHNVERNPRIKAGASVEVVNNVVYGWGPHGAWNLANITDSDRAGIGVEVNFVGNVYRPGPASHLAAPLYAKPPASSTAVYARNNVSPSRGSDVVKEWAGTSLPQDNRENAPVLRGSGVQVVDTKTAFSRVLENAGSRPKNRFSFDRRTIQEVRDRTGSIKDCVRGCERAGAPSLSIASKRHSLVLPEAPHEDTDADGYTNLEEWLHLQAASLEYP